MEDLKFVDHILDNIHGYIALTQIEKEIDNLPIFRRLRRIKQLGLANWIFPGAEHTRYSHSLGVMHIAGKMAERLDFTKKDRQLIRLAGMLHDIGHFPISHVGERAYRKHDVNNYKLSPDEIGESWLETLKQREKADNKYITHVFMAKNSNNFHHEIIGEKVIRCSRPICEILEKYDISIDDICSIITGDITVPRLIKHVQLLHSELDADRIDYLLRDTFSSGTSYGAFEINTLVKNLEIAKHNEYGIDIIGVNSKGIASADQFLANRYFSYSQVFYNKNVKILNYMAECIISWLISSDIDCFPSPSKLLKQIESQDDSKEYFEFTDNFFIEKIRNLQSENRNMFPDDIWIMIKKLNDYIAPEIMKPVKGNNIVVSGLNNCYIYEEIMNNIAPCPNNVNTLLKLDRVYMTEHVKVKDFVETYNESCKAWELKHDLDVYLKHRLINGIAYINKDEKEIRLLTDVAASLIKDLCRHKTILFRRYLLEE